MYSRGAWPSFSRAIWLVRFRVFLTFLKSSTLPYCTSTTSPCSKEQTHKLSSLHKHKQRPLESSKSSSSSSIKFVLSRLLHYEPKIHCTDVTISAIYFVMIFLYSEASFALNFGVNFFGISRTQMFTLRTALKLDQDLTSSPVLVERIITYWH